jgi:uracil-DNA glycosylase
MNKIAVWENLCKEAACCKKCDLGCEDFLDGYNQHVMGQGNLNAKIMFLAEAPGLQETIHRYPLASSGMSGKIYENVLITLGLARDDVYTANVMICRPPKNRDPEPWEMHKCEKYLKKQIELVVPKLIVTFGRFAAQALITDFKITRDHGKLKKSAMLNMNVFSLYHPAYIGAYAPKEKREEFKNDIMALKNILENYDGMLE